MSSLPYFTFKFYKKIYSDTLQNNDFPQGAFLLCEDQIYQISHKSGVTFDTDQLIIIAKTIKPNSIDYEVWNVDNNYNLLTQIPTRLFYNTNTHPRFGVVYSEKSK